MSSKKKTVPLMPIGTALWLKSNTILTNQQIADFCCLTAEDVSMIDTRSGYPCDPLKNGQLTEDMIRRCEENATLLLKINGEVPIQPRKATYLSKHQKVHLPHCVLWFMKNTSLSPKQIAELLKRSEKYILTLVEKVQEDTTIQPKNPIELYICTFEEVKNAVEQTL